MMRERRTSVRLFAWLLLPGILCATPVPATRNEEKPAMRATPEAAIPLPPPVTKGRLTLEEALAARRSVREFSAAPLTERELSQLFWALQGTTAPDPTLPGGGRRTAPSAGALYPLEPYVATAAGLFHYDPQGHRLLRCAGRDVRRALAQAAHDQDAVRVAPAVFAIAAVEARTGKKYGARAARYVHLEAGHAAQNLLLEAVALGLGAVPIGAFDDARVHDVLGLPADEQPFYLIPVGRPR